MTEGGGRVREEERYVTGCGGLKYERKRDVQRGREVSERERERGRV